MEEIRLRRFLVPVLLLCMGGGSASAQPAHAPAGAAVRSLEQAAELALDYRQGDLASLTDVRGRFTPSGWSEFLNALQGWLEEDGAPGFSSRFTPSGPSLDVRSSKGVIRLTIPGVLEQKTRNAHGGVSVTSYRAEIDLEATAAPVEIRHLGTRTCGGAATVGSCR